MASEKRFNTESFRELAVKPLHIDLSVDVNLPSVTVSATTVFVVAGPEPCTQLELNSQDLTVSSVGVYDYTPTLPEHPTSADLVSVTACASETNEQAAEFTLDTETNMLTVTLPAAVAAGAQFVLHTVSVAVPTENILEGLYYDYTPEGRPKTIITQMQQWGCQRLFPCVDRMLAKSFWTVTIDADAGYGQLLSNGDPAPDYVDDSGNPHPRDLDDGRKRMVYYNHTVNMAPYVFFLGCGTWDVSWRLCEYPNGESCRLELLTIPGFVERELAADALNSLYASILWTHISTGAECYERPERQERMYELIERRDALLAKASPAVHYIPADSGTEAATDESQFTPLSEEEDAELAAVRAELKDIIGSYTKTGYQYTGAVYREIAMMNSDFGGMENVGNTTILSSRIAPTRFTTDSAYVYMECVKAHEFYHNINGSEVTGFSPFSLWLNEAVTVFIERLREDALFGHDYARLLQVRYAFTPSVGPLAVDSGPNAMPVEPDAFDRPQQLISAMTYSKAPEVIGMIESIIGKENFVRGLDRYYTKYKYSNATTAQWVECMGEEVDVDLTSIAQSWLKRTGYPTVTATAIEWDGERGVSVVTLKQTGFENKPEGENHPWTVPIKWAAVKDGAAVVEGIYILSDGEGSFEIDSSGVEPDFLSLARDWSFYGHFIDAASSEETRRAQALADSDAYNRWSAYRSFVDREKAAMVENLAAGNDITLSDTVVELASALLFDDRMTPSTRALILSESESLPSRPDLAHHYAEIKTACDTILAAIFNANEEKVIELCASLKHASEPTSQKVGLHARALRSFCLKLMSAAKHPGVADVAREFIASPFMTDRLLGLFAYLRTDTADRLDVLASFRADLEPFPEGWEVYLLAVANLDTDDTPELIRGVMADSKFSLANAGHARTLARGWSANRRRSLLSDDGLDLLVSMYIDIANVNEMSASCIVKAFGDIGSLGERQGALIDALKKMRDGLDESKRASRSEIAGVLSSVGVNE